MNACYEAACTYLKMGLHPIPCAPRSKRPLVKWEPYQTEPPLLEELEAWWTEAPDANVALVLGRGTFAVDLDGGPEAESLLHQHGVYLPPAPMSRTAHGYHVFLSAPDPVPDRVGLLKAPGGTAVDIRGVGIVVAPPSIHPTGALYHWVLPLTVPFPTAPPALLSLIRSGPADTRQAGIWHNWVADGLRGVSEGQRDAMCTRLAGFLLGKGLDVETTSLLLSESFGRACTPPFPAAEVRKCAQSIARRQGLLGTSDRLLVPTTLADALSELESSWSRGAPMTIPTPFPSLNDKLGGGFSPGELIYVGARPGVGKTSLGLEVARRAARQGVGTLYVSREMMTLVLARRLLAQDSRVSASQVKRGAFDLDTRVTVETSLRRLRALPIWLTDEAITLQEIVSLVTLWEGQPRLGLVVVDYLQLLRAPTEVKERRHQIEAVSQGLKHLAVSAQLPVLCLSSVSRPVDGRERRPSLASLRESGELEHDADVVLLLYRHTDTPETECIVAKNRDGRTGTVMLTFRPEYVAFDEVSERQG